MIVYSNIEESILVLAVVRVLRMLRVARLFRSETESMCVRESVCIVYVREGACVCVCVCLCLCFLCV
jgi:hypothetical protein